MIVVKSFLINTLEMDRIPNVNFQWEKGNNMAPYKEISILSEQSNAVHYLVISMATKP